VLRPDHEPLYELATSVLVIEAQRPQVQIEGAVRVARRSLGEEGSYGRGIVSAPGVHVGVDPPLHGVVGQDARCVTSEFSCLIALIILTAFGTTVIPYQLPNILRL
jgi:hypothetical protein